MIDAEPDHRKLSIRGYLRHLSVYCHLLDSFSVYERLSPETLSIKTSRSIGLTRLMLRQLNELGAVKSHVKLARRNKADLRVYEITRKGVILRQMIRKLNRSASASIADYEARSKSGGV